jgi:ferritin
MLNKKLLDEMNDQIKHELYSAYLYLSMAAHCESVNLPGFAHWMKTQAQEETEHALKFFEYINDQGGKVVLQAIDQPPSEFTTPTALFQATLEHEKFVTSRIHGLYALALQEKDYPSQVFLQWFVNEQVEEEKNASSILESIKIAGDMGNGLLMIDRQLAARESD